MNTTKLKDILGDIDAALLVIAKNHGLVSLCRSGSTTINPGGDINNLRFSVEGKTADSLAHDFEALGFPADSCGKIIKYNGKDFKIVGINLKKVKYAIQAEKLSDGKVYGLVTDAVKKAMGIIKPSFGTLIQRPVPQELMKNPLSPELQAKFNALAAQLSPENLSCDGELNKIQQGMKKAKIMQEWKALEKEAGRTVGHNEFPY